MTPLTVKRPHLLLGLIFGCIVASSIGLWLVIRHPASPLAQSQQVPAPSSTAVPRPTTPSSEQAQQIIRSLDSDYRRTHAGSDDPTKRVDWINAELKRQGYKFWVTVHPLTVAPATTTRTNSNPCPSGSGIVFNDVYTDASHLPPGSHSTGIFIKGSPCLTVNGTVTGIGTTENVHVEPANPPTLPLQSTPAQPKHQAPTYGGQTCIGSACAQGPGSQATFNQYGAPKLLLSDKEHDAITKAMSPYAGKYINIVSYEATEDTDAYIAKLIDALNAAHLKVLGPGGGMDTRGIPAGVSFVVSSDRLTEAKALAASMNVPFEYRTVAIHPDPNSLYIDVRPNR